MNIKKTIALIFILCSLTLCFKSQNILHYSQDNICLDELINVNTGLITHIKNLVVENLDNNGGKEVVVTDEFNNLIKIYNFNPATATFTFQNSINVNNHGGFGAGFGKFQSVAAGKFNNDQLLDLIFTTNDSIFIYKQNTSTNFVFSILYKLEIPSAFKGKEHYLKVDNIDNNGNDDFYFLSSNTPSLPGITVIPYLSTFGTFTPAFSQVIFKSSGNLIGQSLDLSIGDVKGDNDGLKDLMITYTNVPDSVFFLDNNSIANSILLNRIGIHLAPTLTFTPDFSISSSELADIDGDTKLDFIFYGGSVFSGNKIAIYQGNNNYNLNSHLDFQTAGINIRDFKLADINDDAKLDFVSVVNYSATSYSGLLMYLGNSNPASYLTQSVSITFTNNLMNPDEIQLSDVDNNGLNDIVIKPWKGNTDRTYMIPNFSYNVISSVTPSVICGSFPATLNANISQSTSTNYNWEFATPTGTFSSIPPTTSTFTTSVAGFYKVHIDFNMYNPNNTCTLLSDTLKVIANFPVISLSTSQNLTICQGNTITTTAMGAATYTWYSSSIGFVSINPTILISGIAPENYTVVGITSSGCKGTTTLNLNLSPPNTDNISASKNPLCAGDKVSLSFPTATSYLWYNGDPSATIVVSPSITSIYQLTIYDSNGCLASKSITLDVDPTCRPKIYTGITINGDNNNNFFRIDNIENYKDNRVTIYNRWGKEIFTTKNYSNTNNYWPTQEHLKTLMPSTYFFVVTFGENSGTEKGWVELISN